MEQDDGLGFGLGCVAEVKDVAIWTQAAADLGAWRGGDGQALSADWDFAVVTDPDRILLSPDKGPPGASWNWSQDGALVGEGLLPGGLWGGAQLGGGGDGVNDAGGAGGSYLDPSLTGCRLFERRQSGGWFHPD